MIKEIYITEIEQYLDLLAEVEHVNLNRSNPDHEKWLLKRIHSLYSRGAMFFAYHDPKDEANYGIISVLHEEAPEGINQLGYRAEVTQIGVSKSSRRTGIGSILLKHAERWVKERGGYCLFIMTYAEDYDVIAFYGKNGFIPVATLPDVYGPDWEGNVFLRKILRK
jgi:GNAT superfamily N-acetyltransferase